ncbi:type IV toxin-antitoxin system AbiEi family antitoxin domain-containing protein [Promicromonospora iranensis]|uniref:Transcriptional regulator of viral defense system n=1 Tax=Promicromonospora iranensis TaxID=1105144 RepID=A0ABU2CNJ0_9MICO|nr:type IV toxin-antitoxin system AbiEi family antitoxin domain-containing protein [Promicromonospora iranensis]MDR7382901.1 putative transcriptional regulator of viral defense system [Promicromonospora iranensis]
MHDLLAQRGPFRTAEARAQGINARTLRAWVDTGLVAQIARGWYQPTDTEVGDPDLIEIVTRSPRATICLTSALAQYDLVDDIPAAYDLALPRGAHKPVLATRVAWRSFDAETFYLERRIEQVSGVAVPIYSPARSVVDAFRMRGYEGYETATTALRRWLLRRGNQPSELLRIARQLPRAEGPLRTALEILT